MDQRHLADEPAPGNFYLNRMRRRTAAISTEVNGNRKEGVMAVKILIKRRVPLDKARDMVGLFRQLRMLATSQEGYISGETLRRVDNPEEYLVISTWQSYEDWQNWLKSSQRKELQSKVDILLGGETSYEVYHYGFTA
jgi:heme-degrading monooxygenase HmoA